MNQIEFINYVETPNERQLGIATIKAWGKILLRYKVMPRKDGSGFFVVPAAHKIEAQYVSAFQLDSISDKEAVEKCILSNIAATNKLAQAATPSRQQFQTEVEFPF